MYACTHRFLHLAATVEALCARAHFLRVFSGLVNEPAKPSKTVGHSIDDFNRSCILLLGYCRHHVGTMNGAISGILGALSAKGGRAPGHGMAERDAAGLQDVRQNPSPAPAHGY